MPIETPIGNLDIKNATLRTSNLETQNIKIGSIFVNSYPGLETTANVGNTTSNTIQFTNTHTAFTTTGNVSVGGELTVTGGVTSTTSLMSNAVTIGTTKTFVVTVQQVNSVNKYFIDGVDRPVLQLHQHQTYIFDLSDSSLTGSPGHPFVFDSSNSNDGTTNSDPYYTTGITTTGAYGSTEKRTFVVPAGAPTTLYYYCTQHPGMGATASISPTAELIVSGRVESTDLVVTGTGGSTLGSGTTAQRPANPTLGMLRYNTETGYFETFTSSSWGSIASPPAIASISPTTFGGGIGEEFTINGSLFDSGSTVVFKGADSTEYAAATVTFVSSIQLKVTNATTLPIANEPYKVIVTSGAGFSTTSTSTIDAGSVPAFTTAAGQLVSVDWNTAISTAVVATDPDTSIASYSIVSGSLPPSVTLNTTTGAITGTTTAQTVTTYTFDVQATDTGGNTNTRQFSIQILSVSSFDPTGILTEAQALSLNSNTNRIGYPNGYSMQWDIHYNGGAYTYSTVATLPDVNGTNRGPNSSEIASGNWISWYAYVGGYFTYVGRFS